MRGSLKSAWSQEHKDKQGQKICLVSSSFANFFVCEVIHIKLKLFLKDYLYFHRSYVKMHFSMKNSCNNSTKDKKKMSPEKTAINKIFWIKKIESFMLEVTIF